MTSPRFSVCLVHSEFLSKYALILTGEIRNTDGACVVPRYLKYSLDYDELKARAKELNAKLLQRGLLYKPESGV